MLTYYQTAIIAECHDCGETKSCTRITTGPEAETGYIDEFDICPDCQMKRNPYDPWD